MTRLLIVSCSRAKRPDASTLPAIDRYDGPTFRMLRKARQAGLLGTVLVILSLAGCAPPPPADTATLDGATLREAVSPPWLWRGADHPEWVSCRLEPPSALCTE